jgi:hypothetical protein
LRALFDTIEGLRHQVTATDTPAGQGSIQFLEARHRGHARVEDRIRTGMDTGFGRFPSRVFAINAAWLRSALTGIDLLAWTQILLCDGDLPTAEPKKLRYRLLHVAARITHSARRTRLRIAETWPLAAQLATALTRLTALPRPANWTGIPPRQPLRSDPAEGRAITTPLVEPPPRKDQRANPVSVRRLWPCRGFG